MKYLPGAFWLNRFASVALIVFTSCGLRAAPASSGIEIVFVDSAIADYNALVQSVRPGVETIVLDPACDEIAQMTAVLRDRRGLVAVHVVSHGVPGAILLGSRRLDATTLAARDFSGWRSALAPGADVLLYGCDVAKGGAGVEFVKALAAETGANVAASNNATGAAEKGGDWVLEFSIGRVSMPSAILNGADYKGVLAAPRVVSNISVDSVSQSDIYVRPGGISYTWTYGVGGSPLASITETSYHEVNNNPAGATPGAEDQVLTIGKFQYSTDGGSNWIDYAPGAFTPNQNSFNTNFVTVSGKIWRFVHNDVTKTTTTNNLGWAFYVQGFGSSWGTSILVVPDNAPTGITESTTQREILAPISTGTDLMTLTPVDGGLKTGGAWVIDSQTVASLFSLNADTSTGNTATLKIGAGTLPADGQSASVTVRYCDLFQTTSSGVAIDGEGFTKTYTFTFHAETSTALPSFGPDLAVNTTTDYTQDTPAIARLTNGNFVCVWSSADQADAGRNSIVAQIFSPTGVKIGGEIVVSPAGNSAVEYYPVVTALSGDRFVVAYNSWVDVDGDTRYVLVGADGTPGAELVANISASRCEDALTIITLSDGSFMIGWMSYDSDAYAMSDIFGRTFSATDGSPLSGAAGNEFTIIGSGGSTDGYVYTPALTALTGGGYVATWIQADGTYARVNSGTPFQVTANTYGAKLAALNGGGFVAVWGGSDADIHFQRYNSAGVAQGALTTVNATTTGSQSAPAVAAQPSGGFIVVWQSDIGDYELNGIFGRRYDASGVAVDAAEFEINEYRRGDQNSPAVVALAGSSFATVWTDNTADGASNAGVEARVLSSNTAPTFVGATTTLTVGLNAAATDIKSLLVASDTDSGQTLTWSQNVAPNHSGAITISGATASSGGTNISSSGTITYTPANGYSGTETFTIQVTDGSAIATRTITVTIVQLPAVTGVSPTSGTTAGGTSVTITGSNFTGATAVFFGSASATGYSVNSATQITVPAPAGAAGTVDVTVTTPNGTSATGAGDQFTYVAPPVVNTQPVAVTGTALGNASFTVAATGVSLSYQWQVDSGSGFSAIVDSGVYGGATTDTLTLTSMPRSMNGYSYRVVVTSANVVSTTSSSATLTVNKATPVVSWTTPSAITYGTALSATQLNATADVAGAFVYTPASGTILNAGANQSLSAAFTPTDTANYNNASGSTTITVNKADQAITFGALGGKTFGDASFTLSATSDSGLTVAFSIFSGPATLSGDTITLTGAGPVVVRASQAGNADFNPATNVDRSFTVAKAAATVTLGGLSSTYNGSAHSATATSSPAGLTVDLTYNGSATAPTAAGSYTVVGTINDTNYAGTNTGTLVIAKATPTVSWTTPSAITYGTALSATQLNATADVAGAFVYTPASGTILNAGANQSLSVAFTPTDAVNYNNASGSTTITVNKADQAITFGALSGKTYGDASFALAATSDSGLTVAFSVVSGPASLSGNNVTLTGSGTVTIRAAQAGNADFNAATNVDQSFIVLPAAPSTPDLVTASDSGGSNSDNITNVTTPTFTGTAEANSAVQLFRGGTILIGSASADSSGNWSITLASALSDGTYSITAKAINASSQTSIASGALNITVDATASAAPAITAIANDTGDSGTDHVTSDTTLVLGGISAANETVTLYRNAVQIGTAIADGSGVWSFDYTGTTLAGGTHTFTANSTDIAGNISVSSAAFLVDVDTSTPSVPVITGIGNDTGVSATDGITNDATVILSGTAEAGATITISRSGAGVIGTVTATSSGVWNFDYSATTLPDGAYLFTAFATDVAGNASTVSADFPVVIDTTAPAISSQPVGGTYVATGSFTLGVAAADATSLSYQWYLDASLLGDTTNRTGSTTASVTHTGIGTIGFGGSYTVSITDLAGNNTTSNVATVVVNKADQTIDFPAITDQLVIASPFSVAATASSGFGVTLSVASGPATITGNVVTLTGVGSVTIRASQAGDLNYNAAPSVDRTFTITKAPASVVLGNLSQTYDGTARSVTATTAPSGLTVNVTYDGGTTVPTSAGSYAVVATISDAQYQGTVSETLVIAKAGQTVNFTAVGTVTVGTSVALSATASSGLSVSFSVLSGNATVSGTSFTANNANAITLRATQAGNANYNAATADQVVTNITKLTQTIAFAALADRSHSAAASSLTATATSSLPVTFTVQSGPATVSGTTLTLTGLPGTVTVVAQQAGDAVYAAAPAVSRSFTVNADYAAPKADGSAASVTGGSGTGSQSVTVSTAEDFRTYATSSTPYIITVVGTLNIGTVNVRSNKTIQGADGNAALLGNLNLGTGVSNVVIRGLNLTNPGTTVVNGAYTDGGDALTLSGASNVFVTHVTFFDCADHAIKIINGSDNVTVSWCEFYNTSSALLHRTSVQIGGSSENKPLHVTLHHNGWGANVDTQMPLSTYGYVHQYNNYFASAGNASGTVVSDQSQLLSERNVYAGLANPLTKQTASAALTAGKIRVIENGYTSCTGTAPDAGTDTVFTPAYSYELLPTSDVATEVTNRAGNTAGAASSDAATGTATLAGPSTAVTPGAPFTLTAASTGFTGTTYQWRLNNVDVAGATSATYTCANIQTGNAGTYTVAISMASGDTVVSTPLVVSLGERPKLEVKSTGTGGGSFEGWFCAALGLLGLVRLLRRRLQGDEGHD